nr:hypothetical protein [Streptomyces taklimakanensis]
MAAGCAALTVLAAVLVPLTLPLGWDERVYAARFGPYGPATPFSAPRTRGVPLLLSPVASWSDSVPLLRSWLLLLFGATLYLGFRPWLEVSARPSAVRVAAGLYGTVWTALFYANSAMPNHYTAMGTLAATGCLLRRRPWWGGVIAGLAVVTLMRPNDGAAVAVALLVATVAVPALRGRAGVRIAAVAGGLAAGALPWVVEAYLRFGGVRERLVEASDTQGGMRPVLGFVHQFTALDGPLLCRPCDGDGVRPPAVELWLLLSLLVALGLWSARRAGTSRVPLWTAVAVAFAAAAQYLFLVPYAAPRFLLPAYALLAVPAGLGLLAAADRARRSRTVAVVLVVALAGHLAVQLTLAHAHAGIQERAREDWRRIATVLHEAGVRAPCLITGNSATIPVAHTAGCSSAGPGNRRRADAVVTRDAKPPEWARDWPAHTVPDTYNPGWTVVVRP